MDMLQTQLFPFKLELSIYDPVGPDDYGYYIYDNEDINYVLAPTYNWVEIDDREGSWNIP